MTDHDEDAMNINLTPMPEDARSKLAAVTAEAQSQINETEDIDILIQNSFLTRRERSKVMRYYEIWKITGSLILENRIRVICLTTKGEKGRGRKDNVKLGSGGYTLNVIKSGSGGKGK